MKRAKDTQTQVIFKKLLQEDPKKRDRILSTIMYMGLRGFHAQTIADWCGITKGQVYIVCRKQRIRLRDYRDGKTEPAEYVLARAPVVLYKGK